MNSINGLNEKEVEERKLSGRVNTPVDPPSKTTRQIIFENVFTYFNFIFVVLAVLLIIAGSYRDLTFLPVIIFNTLIGIIQELRSKSVLDKLNVLNAPTAKVIRNGRRVKIPSEELVVDDIVIFKAGDQIPADAVVIDGRANLNESLLTGESDEILKAKDSVLMSGSYVVSGECLARITKVGADSYISKLTLQAKQQKKGEQSEMIRSLNGIVKIAGILIIPIGGIQFWQSYFLHDISFRNSIRSMVASVIGMIPEGLFLLASVTLAVSAMRLAKNKVLVHDMKCIETLARVDVLCVDKTGTITENTMKISRFESVCQKSKEEIYNLLSDFAAMQAADNVTMQAMKDFFCKPTNTPEISHTGFSSEFKYSSVTFESGAYVLGAPEWILREQYEKYKNKIEDYGRKGYRVLVFAKYYGTPDGKKLTEKSEPLAFVLITNPIRKNAKETFKFFENNNVEIKVISGDNPITVSEVAKRAGIKNAEKYVDSTTLTTDESIKEAMQNYTVFGRVTPDKKRKFINALKEQGRTVAMTGDGVNDVLAMKDADCSVAMASGSDAATQASQLVLIDSDFAHMPDVVAEGRRVVNNLERSGSLFIVKNIFSLILSILAIATSISYPLTPSQISLISMFTIGVPAFLLSQIPNHNIIKGKFLKNIILKALPGGLTDVIAVVAMVTFGTVFEVSSEEIATASTVLLSVVGMMVLYNISKPMDVIKWGILALCAIGLISGFTLFSRIFGISDLSLKSALLCIDFAIVTECFLRYLTLIINGINSLFTGENKKKRI